MKKIISLIALTLVFLQLSAQNNLSDKKHYHDVYIPDAVIDAKYGIVMYEPLNMMLGGDTVRHNQKGYACDGFVEDYYTTGELLHKGFYVEGKLKIYKNYYPNGKMERNFRMVDLKKSKMTLLYKDGVIKSNIVYIENEALKWEDFYPNGTLEFIEEYNKSFEYYVLRANYFENGEPQSVLELVNKKKLEYTQEDYYDNGNIKESGAVKYDRNMFDYKRVGTWLLYDESESGKAIKEQKYINGTVHSEKDL